MFSCECTCVFVFVRIRWLCPHFLSFLPSRMHKSLSWSTLIWLPHLLVSSASRLEHPLRPAPQRACMWLWLPDTSGIRKWFISKGIWKKQAFTACVFEWMNGRRSMRKVVVNPRDDRHMKCQWNGGLGFAICKFVSVCSYLFSYSYLSICTCVHERACTTADSQIINKFCFYSATWSRATRLKVFVFHCLRQWDVLFPGLQTIRIRLPLRRQHPI